MRIKRTLAAASAVAALAAAAIAGPAAAAPTDSVKINAGNVGFGTSFSGHKVTSGGTLDWRQSGSDTDPQLSGTLFIEDSTETYRVAIDHYPSATDHSSVITRNGGDKTGSGGFLDTFPILLGGVTSTDTEVVVRIEHKLGPNNYETVASETEDL